VSLILLTGPVRSGKSAAAERLSTERGAPVVVAVAGWEGDEEMARRIEAHRSARPAHWTTVAATPDPGWLAAVPDDAVLLLDCLGTLVATAAWEAVGEAEIAPAGAEEQVSARIDALVASLLARTGDSVIVSNETGWGVVPAWPGARIFRDELGRANRRLAAAADSAYLVIDGMFLDLRKLADNPRWPR
jgi:adenosylcobinamide kinase / adenosylcobinamide-phosphate guanylyltransferase